MITHCMMCMLDDNGQQISAQTIRVLLSRTRHAVPCITGKIECLEVIKVLHVMCTLSYLVHITSLHLIYSTM